MSDAKQATPMEAMQAALDHAKWLLKNASVCELSAHNEAVRNWALEWDQRAFNAEAALAAANEARDQAKVDLASREQDAWRAGYDFAKLHFYDIPLRNRDEMFSHLAGALKDRAVLHAEVERLREDAERWRYVVSHADWLRHDDGRDRYSRMCVRLPYEADQSCVATRTAAIDAARKG